MQDIIKADLKESIDLKNQVLKGLVPKIESAARIMIEALKAGNKILLCGNGGSAADSQHLAAEIVSRYKKDRKPLSAIALTTDTSIITAVGNDYGFEFIFARQVEGLGRKGDVLVGISTSGESKNVVEAVAVAKSLGMKTIGILGCTGGRIGEAVDLAVIVPCKNTPRIQEAHITIGHILCDLIERELFSA
jgi:D-sedoheptulose 7-phosphate isomerase